MWIANVQSAAGGSSCLRTPLATRAHFESPVREAIYVDLCPEEAESGYCMKLLMSMYGARQAASNWEHFYAEVLKDAGFVQGVSNPMPIHPPRTQDPSMGTRRRFRDARWPRRSHLG